jgi:tetrahydromethanopterin S-methyltransferase subunit B
MPDWWEDLFGLDVDRRDGTGDLDGDGYTNLEEYLGKDGRSGNDDYSDPTDLSSIPVREGTDEETGGFPAFIIVIIAGAVLAALALFFIIRITKRG